MHSRSADSATGPQTGPLRVIIAGGGIGGLAAAIALARSGAEVTVFEKRSEPLEAGAGIQIGPNGTRVLNYLGLAEALRPYIAAPKTLAVGDAPSGRQLAQLPLGDWIAQRHGSPYWVAHRADLHEVLRTAAQDHASINVHRGVAITGSTTFTDEVLANTDSETVAAGDVLIAADGVRSTLRNALLSNAPLKYSGKSAARAVIAADDLPDGIRTDQIGIWLSPLGHVVHYPVRGGRELAIVVIKTDRERTEDWNTRVSETWVRIAVENFPTAVRNLIAATNDWRKWALYQLPPLENWVSGRVALLGDAAHPVLPFLAQGAVLALEDAEILARCLSGCRPETVPAALRNYQQARMTRAQRVQQASRQNGEIYHLDGPMRRARNLTLQYAPAGKLISKYDWLYGWRPEV
ncbi:MAG: FAD-dependent monooxygenase [Alphaproteobacteria bacterium]|nr:FAD-dependent monooxygenase [Alphaproteobacteria bacterium]